MKKTKIQDISKNPDKPLADAAEFELMPIPGITDEKKGAVTPLTDAQKTTCECCLDGVSALNLPKPKNKEEEEKLVAQFLKGLEKLLSKENNWTFLQPLKLSLDYCAKCLACSEACPIYLASGRQDIYRPTYRAEVLRRIIHKYLHGGNNLLGRFQEGDIDLNWATVARLAELAYRCTICRRCTQTCNRGVDNGLITRELRKLFSQEMGIAPKEIHTLGSIKQLKTGASTGVSPKAFKNMVQFAEDEIEEKTGKRIKIPVDKEGADILLIHNSGEFITWPENPEAFAILFEAAGLNWTLSSEIGGYEGTNYGTWYDDVQFSRIALLQMEVARKMKVKKIVVGECGHAHKAMVVVADRLLTSEKQVPRESYLPILEEIVSSGNLNLNSQRNNFPVTLQDPCNVVRLMGIVEPQRKILRQIAPQFREMHPHGVDNYCCGGGSGFGIMDNTNFSDWRVNVAGRMKVKQIIEAFANEKNDTKKYVCAPCSNCKGQIRNLIDRFKLKEKYGIYYGGLVELVVNAMQDISSPFIKFE
jgi:Fe-S oxidoreductase